MTPSGRTNQLLYQAELLLAMPSGEGDQAPVRRMALEEGALALSELWLESFLREITKHARLSTHAWRELLVPQGPPVAELGRLRDLMAQPESWLAWLTRRLEQLHAEEGAARRPTQNRGMIAVGGNRDLGEALSDCLAQAKREIAALRETSQEW
ncbi:hypothetical protein LG290_09505 [Halomonas sediminis]